MVSAVFVLVLGLAFTAVGANYIRRARRMRHYRGVPGKIVSREVVPLRSLGTQEAAFGDGGGYGPKVRYRYTVDGVELEGDRIADVDRGFKRSAAERELARIPDDVTVWYDPARPDDAVLKKHGPLLGILLGLFGSCLALGAVMYLLS